MELVKRFAEGEVDIVAWPTPGHIDADTAKNDLAKELQGWYRPELIAAAQKEENDLLTVRKVTRRIFSPMLDAKGGIISHYDQ